MDSREFIVNLYLKLTADCSIAQLGPPFSYYYADEMKNNIIANELVEVDVKSAFPTICRILYGKDHPFVQAIFAEPDKLKRNILISTTLKAQGQIDQNPYLNELNLWSKMLVLCYVYSKYTNITIIEFVKDGVLIKGERRNNVSEDGQSFANFIIDNNVVYHEKLINTYIRFNKTSFQYFNTNTLKIKGKYHTPPEFLKESILKFFQGELYDKPTLQEIKKYYSHLFSKILIRASLKQEIYQYYAFTASENAKFLNINGELTPKIQEMDSKSYLLDFIYPLLSLFRSHYKQ